MRQEFITSDDSRMLNDDVMSVLPCQHVTGQCYYHVKVVVSAQRFEQVLQRHQMKTKTMLSRANKTELRNIEITLNFIHGCQRY